MAYGKPLKKNFYSEGGGEIAMPAAGEMPPVLADSPELFSSGREEAPQAHPMVRSNNVEEYSNVTSEPEAPVSDNNEQYEADQEEQEETQVAQQKPKAGSPQESFRAIREARERAEWERDNFKAQMQEMQRAMQNQYGPQVQKPQPEPEEVDDFNFDVADDALMEGKHVKQVLQELKKVKKQLRQVHTQSTESELRSRLNNNYPDFDEVVSVDNVKRLSEQYPDVAEALRDTPDKYKMASSAYAIMKKFGIHKDLQFEEDKMKAIKNSQKPRPVASVNPQQGDSPLSKANAFANGLSKDLQKQLLAEMAAARRNL